MNESVLCVFDILVMLVSAPSVFHIGLRKWDTKHWIVNADILIPVVLTAYICDFCRLQQPISRV